MVKDLPEINANSTMSSVLSGYPGAQRALFARYHIGGCSSCSFSPEETLEKLCERNEGIPVDEVIAHIQETHDADSKILIEPEELGQQLLSEEKPKLIDIRTREEHEAVSIPGSEFFTQEFLQQAFGAWGKESPIVIYDHTGERSMDAAAYFIGHGFGATRALRGGIDAFAETVDTSLGRYRVEFD
ncbi:MAG: rhodanese-related sulfurtransferase [Verrucomicrobiales bacterium]|jgi:rhodanese-related sulfurtransferase